MAFFNIRKPRQFEYKPRFYDPKKEELENLKKKYGQIEGESYSRRINFRNAMQEKKDEKMKAIYRTAYASMPLPSYIYAHEEANLTKEQRSMIRNWTGVRPK